MPRRTDLRTVLIVGSGPIRIGQGCEFDYAGVQACRVLRAEGYRVVLVNSNPATIMTDPEWADATYLEPLDAEALGEFRAPARAAGLPVPRSVIVTSLDDLAACRPPAVVRPAFTLGGTGGGLATTREELAARVRHGLAASPIGQVLVEQSLAGWQ